jgi:WD40 repeat protein
LLGISKWLNQSDGRGCPFTLELDKSLSTQKARDLCLLFPGITLNALLRLMSIADDNPKASFGFVLSGDGKQLYHSGFWDNSLKMSAISNAQTIFTIFEHGDTITCMDIGDDGKTFVTGSADTSGI